MKYGYIGGLLNIPCKNHNCPSGKSKTHVLYMCSPSMTSICEVSVVGSIILLPCEMFFELKYFICSPFFQSFQKAYSIPCNCQLQESLTCHDES